MQLKDTDECIALIIRLYGDLAVQWKRTRKYKEGNNWVRDFVNAEGDLIKVVTTPNHDFIGVGLVNALVDNDETIRALKKAAKTIKHCGDYGELWYHTATKQVWWVCGDADCDPEGPTDSIPVISGKLTVVPEITVHVEAEAYPDESAGWVCLGKHGKVVDL